jgi:hypothetical protein
MAAWCGGAGPQNHVEALASNQSHARSQNVARCDYHGMWVTLQERSQQAAAEIDRLQRQLHEASLARVRHSMRCCQCMPPSSRQSFPARCPVSTFGGDTCRLATSPKRLLAPWLIR